MLDYYTELTLHLLADIARITGIDLSRDRQTVVQRIGSEGLAFLTKSLPSLGKDLDSYLSTGRVPTWSGFARTKAGYPKFLGAAFDLVYPTVKSVQCLQALRQLFYLFYKLEQPFDERQIANFSKKFVETDASLPILIDRVDPVLDTARDIISYVLCGFKKENILPRHGPGSVAEGILHADKMDFLRPVDTAEEEFPFYEWCVPSLTALCDNYHNYATRPTDTYGTAKVLFVPKDSRGPRVISCEPATLQYLQQGIAREMVRTIESSPLSRGRVNFDDQTINRTYARYGSMGGGWVTLDMKDASDRVSMALVERLFAGTHVLPMLRATRSYATRLPDGSVVHLRKFAPMGSALCFPVEALVFFALAVSVIVNHTGESLNSACQSVLVYGDDIVCRREDYPTLIQYFPTVGLMFNESKCCVQGAFRESCGLDAFNGVDVTPMKVRTPMSCNVNSAEWLPSWCAYQRALWLRGYHDASDYVAETVLRHRKVPVLSEQSDVPFLYLLGWSSSISHFPTRYNVGLQRREVLALCPIPKASVKTLGGFERLHWFFTGVVLAERNGDSLFPVRFRVTHKKRWCGIPHGQE